MCDCRYVAPDHLRPKRVKREPVGIKRLEQKLAQMESDIEAVGSRVDAVDAVNKTFRDQQATRNTNTDGVLTRMMERAKASDADLGGVAVRVNETAQEVINLSEAVRKFKRDSSQERAAIWERIGDPNGID